MGNPQRGKRTARKNKAFKKGRDTKKRKMDIDQVYDDLKKGLVQDSRKYSVAKFDFDEDLPGGGQFYCAETARHFVNAVSLEAHKKTKAYKKRCRELKKTPYSQEEADRAAGLMKEVLPPLRLSRPSALAAAAGDAGGGGAAATMAVE